MTDRQPRNNSSSHFIVIVPGYMGSLLRDKNTSETVWLDIPALLINPLRIGDILAKMKYPNDNLEPAGIMDRGILYALPWAKLDHYGRLLKHLQAAGYLINPSAADSNRPAVYTFPYDWRQDNRISGRQLGEAVGRWRKNHNGAKAWIIAHSNGGIVARWYIEKEGGKDNVERLFLMGSPWDGAPQALRVLFEGYEVIGRRLLNVFGFTRAMNQLIRTFPSYYQLIPFDNPFLRDANNREVNPFSNPSWLDNDRDRQYLEDGLKFNRELGNTLSVETVCYFGRKKQTTTAGVIEMEPGGKWQKIQWLKTGAGDGTVPERSAAHPQAKERHAFAVDHGNIYVDDQVLAQLDFDLAGGLGGLESTTKVLDNMTVVFEGNHDFYVPGEPIEVYATLFDTTPQNAPVTTAKVEVTVQWREPLPGDEQTSPNPEPNLVESVQDPNEPGTYRASLSAPEKEGIYTLRARIQSSLQPNLEIEETFAVEQIPPDAQG